MDVYHIGFGMLRVNEARVTFPDSLFHCDPIWGCYIRDHTDFMAGPNLRTIRAPQRFVISLDSSHHSGANFAKAEVDSLIRSSAPIKTIVTTVTSTVDPALVAKEKPVKPSLFSADSSSAGGADPNTGVFSDLTGSDFLVAGIRTVINPDTDLQKVYVP
ncbi:hypothetical protein Tco_0281015 [Tanacetum coccineum]